MRMTKIVLALLIVTFVVACNKKEATGTTEPAAAAPEMTAPSQGTAEVKSEGDQMSAPIGNAAPATMNTEGSANMGESSRVSPIIALG